MVGKFSAKKLGKIPGQVPGGRLTILYKETDTDEPVTMCQAEHWAFDSCAAIALSGFSRAWDSYAYWRRPEVVEEFFKFLKDGSFTRCYDEWLPKEFLFLLSKSQLYSYGHVGKGTMSLLTEHPKVFLRDKWKNKSHDGEVFLYRLSFEEDVTDIVLPKATPPKKEPPPKVVKKATKAKEIA